MIINYNSLSRGRDAWLKNDVGEVNGSPPTSATKASRTSWLLNCLLVFAFVLSGGSMAAQTNIANYVFSSSTGATYTPITGGTVFSTSYDNEVSAAITMGGTFPFGGANFTTCYISANGFITFGAAPGGTNYTPLTTLGTTTGAISGFGQDAGSSTLTGALPEIRYQDLGTEFVVQYKDHANYFNRTVERINFQIRLTYATGAINIVYGTATNPTGTSTSGIAPQVGIRGNSVVYASNVNNLYILDSPTGTTCDWSTAVTGFSNASAMLFSSGNANVKITSGLTYTWTPPAAAIAPVRTFGATTAITPNGATLNWTAATGATEYNVQYRLRGTCAWTNFSGNPVSTNSAALTGLVSNSVYQVRVQSASGANKSIYSHIPNAAGTGDGYSLAAGSFSTLQDACTGTPTGGTIATTSYVVCTGTTPSSLTVTGATTGTSGLTYEWQQSTDGGATWVIASGGTGGATATYTPPSFTGTAIQYRAARICSGSGLSGYSNVVQINPAAAPTTQATALVTTTSLNGFTGTWTVGNGTRRMVIVSNAPINDPVDGTGPALTAATAYTSGQQIVFDGTGTSVTVTGLTCNSTYYVKVYDYQRCGTAAPYTYYYNVTSGTNATTVTPGVRLVALPITNNFTGFTGSNLSTVFPGWYESIATGVTLTPAGTTSGWTNTTLGGFTTAKINLYSNTNNEWIISPKAVLTATSRVTFKAAITAFGATTAHATRMQGTDDKVQVLISTDGCGAVWTPLYTFQASNTTALTNVLTDFIVDIPATYNGQTVQIAFQGTDKTVDDAPDYDFHITDVKVELTPSCNGVTGLNVPSVTAITANIAWTASSSAPANGYEWEVRTSGAAGSGATGLVTSGSTAAGVVTASAAGLTGNTAYTVYVRSHCAGSDYSAWSSGIAFTTACGTTGIPYTLDFESAVVPAFPACTSIQNAGTGNNWVTASAPGSGFTSKTLRYAYNTTNAANAWFFTQGLNLIANTTYALSYRYGTNSTTYVEKLKIAYATTATAASMTNVLVDHTSVTGTTPQNNTVYFTAPTTGVYYIGFNAYSAADQNALYVDDVAVNLAPSCLTPSALTVGAAATTANLSWTAPIAAPATGYDYEVRTSGAGGSGATGLVNSGSVTGVTATATSLTPVTTYTAYVRSHCVGSDVSTWIASATFTTTCAALNVPYVMDFSSATVPAMPSCTSAVNAGSGSPWVTSSTVYNGPVFPASQGKYLFYGYSETANANAWFFTQGVNLTANTAYAISYRYGNDGGELFAEKMKVAYGTSASVAGMTTPLADHPNIIAGNLTNEVIFTPTTSGVYFFGFNAYSDADKDILQLDDIKVDLAPTCIKPSAVTSVSTVNGATFSWTPPATAPAIGYEWAVTTSDVPPASGATVTGATATATGLDADTFYYFHVRSKCSASDTSAWVSYLFITGYCMSTTTVPQNYYISSFSTTGAALNVTNASTYSPRGYSNFSSQVIGNYPAATTSFSLTPTNSVTGTISNYGVSVFIDWNNDLDFDDANERVYSAPFSTSTSPRVGTFTIPAGTAYGNYRMRVRADFINFTTNVNACGGTQIGETEDYTFRVMPVPPAITSFTPSTVCSNDLATTVVTLTGTNFTGVTEVKLNDVVTPFTVVSDTSITVNLTASSTAGFFNLYKSGDGSSAVSADALGVIASPVVAPITGPTSVCLPNTNTITLLSDTPIGVWSSSNLDIATVSSGGVVTPVAEGSVVISYSVTDSGCTTVLNYPIAVNAPIVISASTATQTVVTGGTTSFSVTVTGTAAPATSGLTYQWQSTLDGENFTTLTDDAVYSGTNTSTLTLTGVPEELNLTLYNVIISGACTSETSELAVLFVGETGIEEQPLAASICDSGAGTASFTVVASDDVTTYEWQEDQGGDNWQTLSNTGIYSGVDTPTLTLTGVTVANSGWRYKVLVYGIASAESNPVALTVSQGAAVTSDPAPQTVCYTGGNASFTVAATNAASYQWQYSSNNGTSWENVSNGVPAGASYSGTTAATLNVTTTAATATGTHSYRAVVNSVSPCLPTNSLSAQLNMNTPVVNGQPAATSVTAGNTATFTVTATAASATYQWQSATAVGGPYTNVANATPAGVTYTGATTATLSVITASSAAATTALYYKVVVSSGVGCSVESTPAQLTIRNYCTPTVATSTASYFSSFVTTGGVTNINNTSTFSTNGYGNFTNLSASQLLSQTVNFTTTTIGNTVGVAVWVDWNQDATFDSTERVYNTTAYSTSPSGSFVVPATAIPGTTRMRIMMDYNNSNPANPCVMGTRGEVEDYNFTVLVPTPCTTPVAGTITASTQNICVSGSSVLTATGYSVGQSGITFQWYNSAGAISGQTGFTYTTPVLTAPESYFFRATCANGNTTANSNTITIAVSNPSLVSTAPGSRCGTGTVNLGATGSTGTTVAWYAASTGGTPLATGPAFTTPSITATTNYYAAAELFGTGVATVGTGNTTSLSDPVSFANGSYGGMKAQYLITAAELSASGMKAGNITSFGFDVSTAGAAMQGFTVQMGATALTGFGTAANIVGGLSTVYNSATVTPVSGINTLTLNTPFNWDGTSNIIVSTSWSNANSSNASTTLRVNTTTHVSSQSYKKDTETAANMLAFTGSTAASGVFAVASSRPKFILGSTNTLSCTSARTLVAATVTAPPALTLSAAPAAVCSGSSTTVVNVTSPVANFNSYVWAPATGVSGTAATGFTFNPTATTAYTLTATNAAGCVNTASLTVTINPMPNAISITPANTVACVSDAATLLTINGATPAFTAITQNFNAGTTFPSGWSSVVGSGDTVAIVAIGTANAGGSGNEVKITGNSQTASVTNRVQYGPFDSTGQTSLTLQWNNFVDWYSSSYNYSVKVQTSTNGTVWHDTSWGTNPVTANIGPALQSTTLNTADVGSATLYVAFTVAGQTFGMDNWYIDNVSITGNGIPMTWTPTTGLYTNAAATTPYTGGSATSVYAKPVGTQTYTATATIGTCTTQATATVTVNQLYAFYKDEDLDGYGAGPVVSLCSVNATTPPAGYSVSNTDCNDALATVNPGKPEILYDGIDNNCDGQMDEGNQLTTTLLPGSCGTTLASIGSLIQIKTVSSAITAYRLRVTNGSNVQIITRTVPHFTLPNLPVYDYATTYSVEVELQRNGVWLGYYGTACLVSSPAVLDEGGATSVAPSQCGITLEKINTLISTTSLPGATGYRFRVTDITNGITNGLVQTIDRNLQYFGLQMLAVYNYNATYRVEVAVKTTGNYSNYGTPCEISSPKVGLLNCDAIIANGTELVKATSVNGASQYRFQIMRLPDGATTTIDRNTNYFMFNMIPGYTHGATYQVRVAVMTANTWSVLGDGCEITAPGTFVGKDAIATVNPNAPAFNAMATPNPFASDFSINVTTASDEPVQVKVYDMLGKLIEAREVKKANLEGQRVGDRYSAGVYNVVVTQGVNVKTLRVIKR